MPKKRSFSIDVVDTDFFLELPKDCQLLYFHLGVRADDDGYVANFRKILKLNGDTMQAVEALSSSGFVEITPDSVLKILHWKVNNTVRSDRYKPSIHGADMGGGDSKSTPPLSKMDMPPKIDDVKKYCAERGNSVDPNRWFDFYQSKDWFVGKNKMKDWRAAVRTWERGDSLEKKGPAFHLDLE